MNNTDNYLKKELSLSIEPHMFKLIEFENKPKHNVALGDSRTIDLFNCDRISHFANLAYGGASLNDVIKTFWYISKVSNLDTVIIGFGFRSINKYNKKFWVEEAIERKKNFFSYAFNKYTFHAAFLFLGNKIFNKELGTSESTLTKEEFWKNQLGATAKKFYTQFSISDNYLLRLKKISNYCQKNNIKLIFWIPPDHYDLQQRVKDFDLENQQKVFKDKVQNLGEIYDFNLPNELTKKRENFRDPMHLEPFLYKIICTEILNHQPHFSKLSKNLSTDQK